MSRAACARSTRSSHSRTARVTMSPARATSAGSRTARCPRRRAQWLHRPHCTRKRVSSSTRPSASTYSSPTGISSAPRLRTPPPLSVAPTRPGSPPLAPDAQLLPRSTKLGRLLDDLVGSFAVESLFSPSYNSTLALLQVYECEGQRLTSDCVGKADYCSAVDNVQQRYRATAAALSSAELRLQVGAAAARPAARLPVRHRCGAAA